MTRPSDLAPRAVHFDPSSNSCKAYAFHRENVCFHSDGSVLVKFFGIKNDTSRSGFEVRIPKYSDPFADPVLSLKTYINRTASLTATSGPVFISLNKPYKAIKA